MVYRHFLKRIVCFGTAAAIFGGGICFGGRDTDCAACRAARDGGRRAGPSEAAVLSPKTVVRTDVPYGKDEKQRLDVYCAAQGQGCADRPILPPRRVEQGRQERGELQAEVPQRERDRLY